MEQATERDIHFLDYWRVIRSRKEIILAVTLLVVITATAYTLTRPKIYMASTKIELRNDALNVDVFERQAVQSFNTNPFFTRTQQEIIRSRPILERVIETLSLQEKWGEKYQAAGGVLERKDAYRILRNRIKIDPVRDTTLIEIKVFGEDRDEVAALANAISLAYKDRRTNSTIEGIRSGLDALNEELSKQQEKVNEAETRLEEVRRTLNLSMMGSFSMEKLQLQKLEADRIAASVDVLVRKARMDEIANLNDAELLEAFPYIINDNTLRAVKNALVDTELSLTLLQEQYGPAHPDVKRLEAGVAELRNRVTEGLAGLKKGLQADYQVALKKFEKLEDVLNTVKQQDILDQGERLLPFQKEARSVELEREILNALRARVAQEGIAIEVPRTPVEIVENAVAPDENEQVSPKVLLNIMVSIAMGLGLGIGMAYFIEYLDTSVRTVDDVEQYLGLPVIGIIPQKVRPLSEEGPDSPHGEAYRLLRTNMQFSNKGVGGGAFAVVSGGVGEGKSTTLFNLAYVCAQLGDKVLIVDSDLRRPVQHTFLGMSNRYGLTNLLMRDVSMEEMIKPTTIPNLHLLPSGQLPRAALGLLDSQRMRDLVKSLKTRYDYVFFDAPPLMGVSDASILASEVDAVLLVVQYRKYPRTMSARAKRVVDNVGGRILGVVLNNINIMRDDYYYYYHSHYSQYHSASETGGEMPEDDVSAAAVSREVEEQKQEVF